MKRSWTKVFGIGRNKTGTTSLDRALRLLALTVGDQNPAELLIHDWARRDFSTLVGYCDSGEAFQDVPFSLDYTFVAMDQAFPGSKFVLTVRPDAATWYESMLAFQTSVVGAGRIPTGADLRSYPYCYEGWLWDVHHLAYGVDDDSLYDPALYMADYELHNSTVVDYFAKRPDDLLVLDVATPGAFERLCGFLDIEFPGGEMPHIKPETER